MGPFMQSIAVSWMFSAEFSRCTIVNEAGGPIGVTVWIEDQSFSVSNIPVGESYTVQYWTPGESQYVLRVEYDDGDVVVMKEEYIDWGGQTDRIVVSRSGTAWEHESGFAPLPNPMPSP